MGETLILQNANLHYSLLKVENIVEWLKLDQLPKLLSLLMVLSSSLLYVLLIFSC